MLIPQATVQLTGGLLVELFDSTLGSDQASIDSGVGGFSADHKILHIYFIGRTTAAADISSALVTFNNDVGSNYDRQRVQAADATITGATTLASANLSVTIPGANQHAGSAGFVYMIIPAYADTTFHKTTMHTESTPDDTAANNRVTLESGRWRSTDAITRVTFTAGSGNLLAGSRLLIYAQ